MLRRMSLALCALATAAAPALAAAAGQGPAAADPHVSARRTGEIGGTVVRVDPAERVIVLDDGGMFRLTEDGAVPVDGRPAELARLEPGTRVVIHAAEPVTLGEGRYVVVVEPGAAAAVAPAPAAAAVTTARPIAIGETVTGTVERVDGDRGVVVFRGGRAFLLGPASVVLRAGRPVQSGSVLPGMTVTLSALNPVVSGDGRAVLLNEGFMDGDTGSALSWDATYEGYEAIIDNAGMQIQAP